MPSNRACEVFCSKFEKKKLRKGLTNKGVTVGQPSMYHQNILAAHMMENDINIEQAEGPSLRAAYHRGQNAAVAPEKPAASARSAGASSSERDHDLFVLRPSANHSCCICASSSGSSAKRASHGKRVPHRPQQQFLHQPQCLRSRHSSSRLMPRRCQSTRLAVPPPLLSPSCGRVGCTTCSKYYPLYSYHPPPLSPASTRNHPPVVNVAKFE